MELNAAINPKVVNKADLNLVPKTANKPTLPEPVRFSPIAPNIVPPDDPSLPVPPTFAVVLGADCNWDCNSYDWRNNGDKNITPRQRTKNGFLDTPTNKSIQNTTAWLHYTWRDGVAQPNGAEKSYAFKMYAEENTSDITDPQGGSVAAANTVPTGNEYNFNSYNFGNEFPNAVAQSQEGATGDKNHQYFFIGGSRFWEIDNLSSGNRVFPSTKTLNLGGILTLGLVSQQNGVTLKNAGTITDVKEKDDDYIKQMPYDTSGAGAGQYKTIYGPANSVYHVKRSDDGYVGYKVGIAQVYENGDSYSQENQILENAGTISFFGKRSIGMYTYCLLYTSDAAD